MAIGLGIAIFVGPLALAVWWDRRRAEANSVQAEVSWQLNRKIGGGLFAMRVVPRFLRGGIVHVDGAGLPEELGQQGRALAQAIAPAGYVVRGGRGRWLPRTPQMAPGLAKATI
jgi:hypothetical protein